MNITNKLWQCIHDILESNKYLHSSCVLFTRSMINYTLLSSLQIHISLVRWWDVACSLFDTWPHMLPGVLSKLLTFHISIIHCYRVQFHILITEFALFRSLETVLVLYNLIIRVLCFNAHVTCIHSNTCDCFDMIEPLDKTLADFKSPARDVLSSNTAEPRICRPDCNV